MILLSTLKSDIEAIFKQDPAAINLFEVLFCYPGFHAICCYRLTHWLYCLGIPILPRLISHIARFLTGIEIHPGARIGKGVFIDHGMGVVIGETAFVGNYSLIYQGVTLGGTGKEKGKRHPTVGNNVIIGAGAKILGNIQIGDHSLIGASSVVLQDVPSNCTVVGIPGRIVRHQGNPIHSLNYLNLPETEAEVINTLYSRISLLEQEFSSLKALLLSKTLQKAESQ